MNQVIKVILPRSNLEGKNQLTLHSSADGRPNFGNGPLYTTFMINIQSHFLRISSILSIFCGAHCNWNKFKKLNNASMLRIRIKILTSKSWQSKNASDPGTDQSIA
jgi:hypothetical protein